MPAMKVKTLDQKRAEYDATLWLQYDLLYRGGAQLHEKKSLFLIKNTAESSTWYEERLKRFTYKNIIGSIIDDYAATVLQEPLSLNLAKKEGAEKRPEPDEFYTKELWPDPTNTGEGDLNDLAFKTLTGAMVKREAWVMVAMPERIPGFKPVTLAEQEASGELRVMLRPVKPENVINCHYDQEGLAWVMLRYRYSSPDPLRELGPNDKPMETIQWTLLKRQTVQSWTFEVERGKEPKETDVAKPEQEETLHHLAQAEDGKGMVPARCFKLSDTLWLIDRVSLLVLEELRKRNALAWYEFLTCFPQLAHSGEEELIPNAEDGGQKNRARGGQYCWEMGPDDTLEWLEPAGSSLEHVSERLDKLERDIYKGVSQMAAAQGPGAAAAIQSGASKVRDNVAKTILCERYAARLRTEFKELAELASAARGDENDWVISGASRYDTQDSEMATKTHASAQNLRFADHTPTFVKALAKKTIRSILPDLSTEMLDEIDAEIEKMEVKPLEEMGAGNELGNLGKPPDARIVPGCYIKVPRGTPGLCQVVTGRPMKVTLAPLRQSM